MSPLPIRVVHTTASLHARNGGPPRTISALAEGLGDAGLDVSVVAYDDGEPSVRPDARAARTLLVERAGGAQAFGQAIADATPEIVHDHGLWLPTNHAAAQAARRLGAPLVATTRGMLEPWARRQGRIKKALAWRAYQRRNLEGAAVLHATAESEAQSIRDAGLRVPVAVVPNGVVVPPDVLLPTRTSGAPRRALFLSRVHPKKGLPMLLDAWAAVQPGGWELVIVGPDDVGHRADLEAQAQRLGLPEVSFQGTVADEAKWDLYRSADLFVLPTYSENFGVVVAEALAAGVPVVTTIGAPWADLETHACGWWVAPETRSIAEALRAATAASDAERAAMGARGRALVARAYGWPGIAARMAEVYDWVLGRRPDVPAFIWTD